MNMLDDLFKVKNGLLGGINFVHLCRTIVGNFEIQDTDLKMDLGV